MNNNNLVSEIPAAPLLACNHYFDIQPTTISVKAKAVINVQNWSSSSTDEDPVVELSYEDSHVIAHGSFGLVFKARLSNTGEMIAIKKILLDKRYKNRELEILRLVNHQNIIKLKYYFFTKRNEKDDIFLGLAFECYAQNLFQLSREYKEEEKCFPPLELKAYTYQILRGLAYLHVNGIVHRDIKPQNMLLVPATHVLRICDFGTAKILLLNEESISYICSRYYRAPELIFASKKYSVKVDVWSAGCIFGELILFHHLFRGENWVEQIFEIMKVLGVPTREEIISMNYEYGKFEFLPITPISWSTKLEGKGTLEHCQFLTSVMKYSLEERPSAFECLAFGFFDDLRINNKKFEDGKPFPPLFDFTKQELKIRPELNDLIIPEWYRKANKSSPYSSNKVDQEPLVLTSTQRRQKRPSRFRR